MSEATSAEQAPPGDDGKNGEREWPSHFPPGCPPDDADALGGVVYMLVETDPPTPKDMECAIDRGSFVGKWECGRAALSCARDAESTDRTHPARGAAMMGEWNLPKQAELAEILDLRLEQVLVEYDGPQIVTARGPRGLYFGLAADEDDLAVRWIYAPITGTELRALAAGAICTRDAISKPQVHVIDVDHHGKPLRAWACDAAQIGDENLPDPGALLPRATRDALMAASGT
ncbi:MAG TPA: hypothetical protein VLS89_07070 [Candidatus Nanopelagicales bacterium]|nr:hypothetical protein [Candidatus Nanopelagicales bacterium]